MRKILRHGFTIGLLAMGLLVPSAFAHHQLGLPHYRYSDEYPQIPTLVIDADAEGYTVTFSTYPGNPQPGDTVRVSVYIRHTATGKVYEKPIDMSVSVVKFPGRKKTLFEPVSVEPLYNEYKISYVFPEAEKYLVNVSFEPREGYIETIPFPIVIGQTKFSLVPIAFAGLFLTVFLAVGFSKGRRRPRKTGSTQSRERKG